MILDTSIIEFLLDSVKDVLSTVKIIFENVKVYITIAFSFFPSEINVILVTVLTVLGGLYIYRLVR